MLRLKQVIHRKSQQGVANKTRMCVESLHKSSAEHWVCEDGEFACKHSQATTKTITGNEIKADVEKRL